MSSPLSLAVVCSVSGASGEFSIVELQTRVEYQISYTQGRSVCNSASGAEGIGLSARHAQGPGYGLKRPEVGDMLCFETAAGIAGRWAYLNRVLLAGEASRESRFVPRLLV
jgi:hypothetical protein